MGQNRATDFVYRRMVRYSDCDASRNYYTPRAIEYSVEAVEEWCEELLGLSFIDLACQRRLELRFLHMGSEFRKTLTAGEEVLARVCVAGIGDEQIRFLVSGENRAGELCFRAGLTACFAACGGAEPVPIPPDCRDRIEHYRAKSGAMYSSAKRPVSTDCVPQPPAGVTGELPFSLARRVVHGDCTPSGTIYPPRLFDYLLEALGVWYETFLGISWMEQNILGRGQPFLQVSCDYLRPIGAGELISTSVVVSRLGRSSISYLLAGHNDDGACCFVAQMAACYSVDRDGALKATPFPDDLRGRIAAYSRGSISV